MSSPDEKGGAAFQAAVGLPAGVGSRAEARLQAESLPHEMIIRAATAADIPEIAAIQAASPEAAQWDPADHLNYDCRVAIVSERVAGFLTVRETAPGEREILNLAVAPDQRRRGIARRLLQEELLRAGGEWYLEVRESNAAAIGLYASVGFKIAGRRPGYYHGPSESGIILKWSRDPVNRSD